MLRLAQRPHAPRGRSASSVTLHRCGTRHSPPASADSRRTLLGSPRFFSGVLSPRVPLSVPRHVPLSRSPRLLRTVTLPSGQVRGGELCSTSLGTSLYIKCPQLLCMRDLSLLPIYLFIHSFVCSIIGVNMDSRILCILYFALVLFQHFLMYLVPQIAAAVAIGNSVLVDTWPPWTHAPSLCVFLSSSFFPDTVRCSGRRLHARP